MKNIVLIEIMNRADHLIRSMNLPQKSPEATPRKKSGGGVPMIHDEGRRQGETEVAIRPLLIDLVRQGYKVLDAHWQSRGDKGRKVRIVFGKDGQQTQSGDNFDLNQIKDIVAPILFVIRNEEEGTDVIVIGSLSKFDPRSERARCPKYIQATQDGGYAVHVDRKNFVQKPARNPSLTHTPFSGLKG